MRLDLELTTWICVTCVLFLGMTMMVLSMFYLDRSSETIRDYLAQRTRISLATTVIVSIPLCIMAASHPKPIVVGLVAFFVPLAATRGVTSVRCPRCKSSLGVRTGFAVALSGMGGHARIDYCDWEGQLTQASFEFGLRCRQLRETNPYASDERLPLSSFR